MKIGPFPPPAPAALPASPAEPSRPFEDFLDTAYGFAELGMFGHGGGKAAESGPGPGPGPGPGTCRGPASAEPLPPAAGEERAAEPAAIPHARAFSPRPAPGEAHRAAASRAPAPARAKPQLPAGELPPPGPETDEPEAAMPVRRAARRLPPPRSDVSLIVTEKDGRVELVAAAPKLDPETRAALRRLVREILARSGLGLAYFQLNGTPVAADSLDIPGGFHGTRSR